MKKSFLNAFLALSIIFIMSGCGQPGGTKLDSFEGEISRKTVDYGSDANSVIDVVASSDAQCGSQSLQINYDLAQEGYLFCARGYGLDVLNALWEAPMPDKVNWSKYQGISFQMLGQGKGTIAFDVKDAGGEMWRFLVEDTTAGWREVVVGFDQFKVRTDWQPSTADGNKQLDFPIQSFQFEPKTLGEGSVSFDCVELK
ncbi:MAG: hypothetical protein KC684_01930 [Candidatus Omnitrophica bacterium]|nr:hypothetical protein [Candidatus Omnitrophota bacterium]